MEPSRGEIRHAVLSHLLRDPDAEDDLTGIAEWWVMEHCVRQRVGEVAEELGRLVASGLVLAREQPGGGTRYRLNRDRLDEVRVSLAAAGAADGSGKGGR